MMFFNKKAQSITMVLFYSLFGLILAAFFVFAVMGVVRDATNDSSYRKKFYASDLALLVDSLHAVNGNFSINYEMNIPEKMQMDIDVTQDKVIVTDSSDVPLENRHQTTFPFGYNDNVELVSKRTARNLIEVHVIS